MSDWSITITDSGGTDHTPALYAPPGVDLPRRKPRANGRPQLEFGVLPDRDSNGDPKFFDSSFEEADVAVTLDGTDQPYSTIVAVEDRPADGIVILTAEGGDELDQPVDTTFGVIETHAAAEQLITNNTSYGTDVPTPSTTTETDTLVQDQQDGFASSDLVPPPADDSPVHVDDSGNVTLHQSLFIKTASELAFSFDEVGDSVELDFTLGYSIPADRVGAGFDTDIQTDIAGIEFKVDGEVIGRIEPGQDVSSAPAWVTSVGAETRIPPGDHTFSAEATALEDEAGNSLSGPTPEAVAVWDDKYSYTFDPDLVTGPELYPDAATARFREPLVTKAVTGARVRGYFADNEAGTFTVGNGQESSTVQNDASVDADFSDRGAVVSLEVELGRYGNDTSNVPEQGFKAETLTGYRLFADLETMPLVVDESFEGTVADVLSELADTLRGDFVWAYDTDSGGNSIIRFVRVGSQTTTENDLEDYTVRKDVSGILDEVTVRGGRVRVDGEGVRLQHGTAIPVDRDRLSEDSETVRDPDTGAVYEHGTGADYTIDYAAGEITALSDGDIADAQQVRVSYEFQPAATVSADTTSTPTRSETIDILPLRSDRACRLAGRQLIDALATPAYQAEATVRGNTTYSVVTELAAGRLPVSSLETVDIEATPAGTTVRLDARQSLGDVVGEIRDRIQSVARHTR